ncbi:MAG: hypothetical protein OQL20_00215 [Sedimenticola sp.]|nr:hypothetical protein [Sedimenticola sp.]
MPTLSRSRSVRSLAAIFLFSVVTSLLSNATLEAETLSGEVLLKETVDYQCSYPIPSNYVDIVKGNGAIPLVLPKEDGPIKGKGAFVHHGSGYSFAGALILEGRLEKGNLIFPFPKGYSGNQQVYNRKDIVTIRAEKDAVTVLHPEPDTHGVRCSGDFTWTLTKPRERWRITILDEGTNVAMTGGNQLKEAGLIVGTQRIVDVTIEKEKLKEAKGRASFVSMKGYSSPPGIYECKAATTHIVGTGTDIETERLDQTKWAKRFNPPKTAQDALLKKEWEKLKKGKTPVLFPEHFSAQGKLNGKMLDLQLPEKSGYTVGIYCQLNPKIDAVKTQSVKERLTTDRVLLDSKFQVTLSDGWHHETSWTLQHPGRPTRNGTTKLSVMALD